jgi:tetratricopeptide (TPR) repeat protein
MNERATGYSPPGKEGNDLRNAAERKEGAERKLREADAYYAAGLRRFLAEDLEGAIREWEKALWLDPAHPKARRDIEKARRLKGKIEPPN